MQQNNQNIQKPNQQIQILLLSGVGCSIAALITNPFDIAKCRLQNQGNQRLYKNFFDCIKQITSEEGLKGLTRGMPATVMREMSYSGLRFGLYEPIRQVISGKKDSTDINPIYKFISGLLTGSISSCCTNPTDVVHYMHLRKYMWMKVQLKGYIEEFVLMQQEPHLQVVPNQDVMILLKIIFQLKGMTTHFIACWITGIITTTVTQPADVIKTRSKLFLYTKQVMADNLGIYKGPMECTIKTFKNEGISAFMKGWIPSYLRIGTHTMISLLLIEKFRKMAGIKAI